MTTSLDISSDLASVADASQPVSLRRPGSAGSTSVTHALRRAATSREAQASGGRYTAADVVWNLPAAEVSAPVRPADQIVDDAGQRWTVLEAQLTTLGARWRCVARNLAVVHGLNEFIRIQRATWTKSDAGALSPTWTDEWDGLSARIQPRQGDVQLQHDSRILRATHRIYVLDDVTIDSNQRIVDADGRVYHVLGYERPQRIDQLLTINVMLER